MDYTDYHIKFFGKELVDTIDKFDTNRENDPSLDRLVIAIPGMTIGLKKGIFSSLAKLSKVYPKGIAVYIHSWKTEENLFCLKHVEKEAKKYNIDLKIRTESYNDFSFRNYVRTFNASFGLLEDTDKINLAGPVFKRLVAFYSYNKIFNWINEEETDAIVFKTRSVFGWNEKDGIVYFKEYFDKLYKYVFFQGFSKIDYVSSNYGSRWLLSDTMSSSTVNDSLFFSNPSTLQKIFKDSPSQLAKDIARIYKKHLSFFTDSDVKVNHFIELKALLSSATPFIHYDGGFLLYDLAREERVLMSANNKSGINFLGENDYRVKVKEYHFVNGDLVVHDNRTKLTNGSVVLFPWDDSSYLLI